jgi:hypothetical protein
LFYQLPPASAGGRGSKEDPGFSPISFDEAFLMAFAGVVLKQRRMIEST